MKQSPFGAHLLVIERSLHRGPVLHLLGQPAVAGASQMLLLHGGSNAYRSGLLVLQHVSEALEVGGKKREEVKKKGTGHTEQEEEAGFPHHFSHLRMLFSHPRPPSPLVPTYFLSQSQ